LSPDLLTKFLAMSNLSDEQVLRIAWDAAEKDGAPAKDIVLAQTIGSTGDRALDIKYILPPGSMQSILGTRSSATVSQVIMEMADANDRRIPIVRYAPSET
jgi:hypothetical protein